MKKMIKKSISLLLPVVFTGLILTMPLKSAIFAQEYEYEADEGLHQEEWYDPSDWFDSGAGVDYESDWNDFYYGYDSNDPWYQDDWLYNREYNYGLAPRYGNDRSFDTEPFNNNYYTEDWYDDTFKNWYEGNTRM